MIKVKVDVMKNKTFLVEGVNGDPVYPFLATVVAKTPKEAIKLTRKKTSTSLQLKATEVKNKGVITWEGIPF